MRRPNNPDPKGKVACSKHTKHLCGLGGVGGRWDLGQLLAKPVFSSSCLYGKKYQKMVQFALCLGLIPFNSYEKPLTTRLN